MGSPPKELLDKFKKYATHMEFNFPLVPDGSGIETLLPNASKDAVDLVSKLLIYNPDNRITAS
jgi:renal tumor antigen